MDQQAYLKADRRFQTAWRHLSGGLAMLGVAALLVWALIASWNAEPVEAVEAPARRPPPKQQQEEQEPPLEVTDIPGAMKFIFLGVGALILVRTGVLVIKDSLPRRPRTTPR